MIFVLVGRRIDLPGMEPARFPLRNTGLVRSRLAGLFEGEPPGTLICSAACGSDLLALETAGRLGWRRIVILPFDRARFRETSVTDRPGDWGKLFDWMLDEVDAAGGLMVAAAPAGRDPYAFVNDRMLEEAGRLAGGSDQNQIAVVVWDGASYGPDDLTGLFAATAAARGMRVCYVSTAE
jgi:hypothetical protein